MASDHKQRQTQLTQPEGIDPKTDKPYGPVEIRCRSAACLIGFSIGRRPHRTAKATETCGPRVLNGDVCADKRDRGRTAAQPPGLSDQDV